MWKIFFCWLNAKIRAFRTHTNKETNPTRNRYRASRGIQWHMTLLHVRRSESSTSINLYLSSLTSLFSFPFPPYSFYFSFFMAIGIGESRTYFFYGPG